MARPFPNDLDTATASTAGARIVEAGFVAFATGLVAGTARFHTSNSTDTISGAPKRASISNDVGADLAPTSSSFVSNVRRKGMGALGRRTPAR